MRPLDGLHVVSLALNAPGPLAAAALRDLGARVTKVEPPAGDPLNWSGVGWYQRLTAGIEVRTLDLKQPEGHDALDALLGEADLLLTAQRPAALARLGLEWDGLHARFPRLCYVAIIGYPPPRENVPGHDLTYQAAYGIVNAPHMPRVLVADFAGAERAVQAALALLLARERGQGAGHRQVALSDAAEAFSETFALGVTAPGGILGGGLPNYAIYDTREGYLACAALEPHFYQRLIEALACTRGDADELTELFKTRTAAEWEAWAEEHDLPLAAIRP